MLLPISFCKMLGMVPDMSDGTVHWKKLNRSEYFQELPSGHIAIDIFDFPEAWVNPH